MNAAKVVPCEVDRNCRRVVLNLLTEGIQGQSKRGPGDKAKLAAGATIE
jgi:hypothetical protein